MEAEAFSLPPAREKVSKARCGEGYVRPGPRLSEPLLNFFGLFCFSLCFKAFHKAEERPAVLRIPPQVFPIDCFCFCGATRLEEHRPQGLPHRIVPVSRLGIDQSIL